MALRFITFVIVVTAMNSANAHEIALENANVEHALARHAKEQDRQSHRNLLVSLNKARYVIPARDREVKLDANGAPTQESKFQFLLSSSPDKKPLLPLFTTRSEMTAWANGKSDSAWNVSAQEAWVFAKKFKLDVIVNPLSAGWVMGEESITWLQNHK